MLTGSVDIPPSPFFGDTTDPFGHTPALVDKGTHTGSEMGLFRRDPKKEPQKVLRRFAQEVMWARAGWTDGDETALYALLRQAYERGQRNPETPGGSYAKEVVASRRHWYPLQEDQAALYLFLLEAYESGQFTPDITGGDVLSRAEASIHFVAVREALRRWGINDLGFAIGTKTAPALFQWMMGEDDRETFFAALDELASDLASQND